MSKQDVRYAIYFLPEADSELWQLGSQWLGYDAITGESEVSEAFNNGWTSRPRKYGFHITVKAPFRLKEEFNERDIVDSFREFCANQKRFTCPGLMLDAAGFVALRPRFNTKSNSLAELEKMVVQHFDNFRAPMSPQERLSRVQGLNPRQIEYLDTWGYSQIFENYYPHFTLSNSVSEEVAAEIVDKAQSYFNAVLDRELAFDGLSLLKQENGGEFKLLTRVNWVSESLPRM